MSSSSHSLAHTQEKPSTKAVHKHGRVNTGFLFSFFFFFFQDVGLGGLFLLKRKIIDEHFFQKLSRRGQRKIVY
ncbi:unnamed protein product [Sphagnum tenellum]